uniref:Uncharacterized protein n=1 Tax=Arundo donax TaxID=35708 RepID=A0A0A9GIE7_ARUDO
MYMCVESRSLEQSVAGFASESKHSVAKDAAGPERAGEACGHCDGGAVPVLGAGRRRRRARRVRRALSRRACCGRRRGTGLRRWRGRRRSSRGRRCRWPCARRRRRSRGWRGSRAG